MTLKRKRSYIDCSPFSITSTTTFQSSSSRSQTPTPVKNVHNVNMDVDEYTYTTDVQTSDRSRCEIGVLDFNSRTKKRFKNNRPCDQVVHGIVTCQIHMQLHLLLLMMYEQTVRFKNSGLRSKLILMWRRLLLNLTCLSQMSLDLPNNQHSMPFGHCLIKAELPPTYLKMMIRNRTATIAKDSYMHKRLLTLI
jgi:hypothetical protein